MQLGCVEAASKLVLIGAGLRYLVQSDRLVSPAEIVIPAQAGISFLLNFL